MFGRDICLLLPDRVILDVLGAGSGSGVLERALTFLLDERVLLEVLGAGSGSGVFDLERVTMVGGSDLPLGDFFGCSGLRLLLGVGEAVAGAPRLRLFFERD